MKIIVLLYYFPDLIKMLLKLVGITMQEEAPEAPAQIIRSVMLLPQWRWQSELVSRGRAACCRRGGVFAAKRKLYFTFYWTWICCNQVDLNIVCNGNYHYMWSDPSQLWHTSCHLQSCHWFQPCTRGTHGHWSEQERPAWSQQHHCWW